LLEVLRAVICSKKISGVTSHGRPRGEKTFILKTFAT